MEAHNPQIDGMHYDAETDMYHYDDCDSTRLYYDTCESCGARKHD